VVERDVLHETHVRGRGPVLAHRGCEMARGVGVTRCVDGGGEEPLQRKWSKRPSYRDPHQRVKLILRAKLNDGLKHVNQNCSAYREHGLTTFRLHVSLPYTSTRTLRQQPLLARSDLFWTGVHVVELHQLVVDRVHQGESRLHQ